MTPLTQGLIYMGLGVIFITMMDGLIKHLGSQMAVVQVVWLRALFGMLPILAFAVMRGSFETLKTRKPGFHVLRAMLGLGALGCFALGLREMTLANATAIVFSAPFFMVLLSAFLIGEKIGRHRYTAMGIGFVGVLIIVRPDEGVFENGFIYMTLCAFCYALSQVLTRKYAKTESALSMTFWTSFGMVLVTGVALVFYGVPLSLEIWALGALMGFFGSLGHLMMTQAARLAPPSALAPMEYSALIWAAVLDIVFWSIWPDLALMIGACVIIGSGLYIFWRENQISRQMQQKGMTS